jgi:hypothetical protein
MPEQNLHRMMNARRALTGVVEERLDGLKRPGFAGGSDPTEGWADASTEEVSG